MFSKYHVSQIRNMAFRWNAAQYVQIMFYDYYYNYYITQLHEIFLNNILRFILYEIY